MFAKPNRPNAWGGDFGLWGQRHFSQPRGWSFGDFLNCTAVRCWYSGDTGMTEDRGKTYRIKQVLDQAVDLLAVPKTWYFYLPSLLWQLLFQDITHFSSFFDIPISSNFPMSGRWLRCFWSTVHRDLWLYRGAWKPLRGADLDAGARTGARRSRYPQQWNHGTPKWLDRWKDSNFRVPEMCRMESYPVLATKFASDNLSHPCPLWWQWQYRIYIYMNLWSSKFHSFHWC